MNHEILGVGQNENKVINEDSFTGLIFNHVMILKRKYMYQPGTRRALGYISAF